MGASTADANTIRAKYRIVTPTFCGGAEQQAEFRLPSFKGVLRYWWRALEWGRIQNLATLQKEEAELFAESLRLCLDAHLLALTEAFIREDVERRLYGTD